MFRDKILLITGGTGSFGTAFVKYALEHLQPKKIIIYSRDEFKQYEMERRLQDKRLRFFIGDVRDPERLHRAFQGVDFVIHAAALKHVGAAEYNPFEAVQTNIIGAENVINKAIDAGIKQVIALSTDKACNPVNLYGATKLCSDKLFVAANAYSGSGKTRFSIVRYGNVVESRGSVVPLFRRLAEQGDPLPITDDRMTRFWITLSQAVTFVVNSFHTMHGGEMFIPKIPSMRVVDLAEAIAPGRKTKVVGIRPGEKLHEMMISRDDSRNLFELPDRYIKMPDFHFWESSPPVGAIPVGEGFEYGSDTNSSWLSSTDLRKILEIEGV